MNVWKSWAESKGLNNDIVKYEAKELNQCRKKGWLRLRVMLAALDRHLKQNDSKISIAKDRAFVKCTQVLEGNARAILSQRTTKCNKSTYRPRWSAMEKSGTWRAKSKVTPLHSVVSSHPLFWSSRLPKSPWNVCLRFQLEQGQSRYRVRSMQRKPSKDRARRSKKKKKGHPAKNVCHWRFPLSSPVLQNISCPQTWRNAKQWPVSSHHYWQSEIWSVVQDTEDGRLTPSWKILPWMYKDKS